MTTPRHGRTGQPVTLNPEAKTYAASRAVMRRGEERAARMLRSRGWVVLPPGTPTHQSAGKKLVDVPLPLEES